MYSSARGFADEGQQTHRLLTDIVQHTAKDSNILLVCDPADSFEWSFSLETLLFKYQRTLHALAVKRENYDNFWHPDSDGLIKEWEKKFSGKQSFAKKGSADVIVFLDSGLIKEVEKRKVLDLNQYKNLYKLPFRFALFVRERNNVR